MRKLVFLGYLLASCCIGSANTNSDRTIIISGIPNEGDSGYFRYYRSIHNDYADYLSLEVLAANIPDMKLQINYLKEPVRNKAVKWIVDIAKPSLIRLPYLQQPIYITPGDSLQIGFENGLLTAQGRGADGFLLQYKLALLENNSRLRPKQVIVVIDSVQQFFQWQAYFEEQLTQGIALIESCKDKLSPDLYNLIRYYHVISNERERGETFVALHTYLNKNPGTGIKKTDLKNMADTLFNKPSGKWLRSQYDFIGEGNTWYFFQNMRTQLFNDVDWNFKNKRINTPEKRLVLYYSEISKRYKGELRERLLQFLLVEEVVKDLGYLHPLTQKLLAKYYTTTGFPEYKQWMRNFEDSAKIHYNFGERELERQLSRSTRRAIQRDGPYIVLKGDSIKVNYINRSKLVTKNYTGKKTLTVDVNTDRYPKTFTVQLKPSLQNEACTFPGANRQLVISDIEGNFDQFRKLLQANGVIDGNFNWTFGNNLLILNGDFFDRGDQVTEVLWLIYSLEEKAKAAGGYVHFILGNHEIFNLSGDIRYVKDKYKNNADVLGVPYKGLYGENTELGKWLRTKNIMEKIGDALYCHGGISRDVNNLPLTPEQMNEMIRPHYADRDSFKTNRKTPALRVLFNSAVSPFWYRGYYKEEGQQGIIDSTLQKFGIGHIITGHTIVADTISMHYGGKVFNTDTHHAQGLSEALLIEGDHFYRVNDKGEKHLLFVDDKKRKLN